MAKDNRRVITWTHIESSANYRNSIKKYYNKIYSIGIHEFGVTREGKFYNYNTEQNYFNANGTHTGTRFPVIIEQDMLDYPSIKWFFQAILFGWTNVKPFLDNNVVNSEGRLPQDQFIYELNKILDLYQYSRNSGRPLNVTGVEIDFEASMTGDTSSQGYDLRFVQFLERLKRDVLNPRGLKLRVNAYAMWGDNVPYYYRFHNYKLFAESSVNGQATIDEIQLMTYDFAWNGSSAGASTPIWWFKNVAEWCKKCFDPSVNKNAKLTIDKLYFGAAGYGHRWGMHDQEVVKSGSNVTYHQLLGWQNGQYRHYTYSGGVYNYHNQEYLPQISFQDEESHNQVMYPHVYDMFKPSHGEVKSLGSSRSATIAKYNGVEYATTYSKIQMPIWTNVLAVATSPFSTNDKCTKADNVVREIDGTEYTFDAWFTNSLIYEPSYRNEGGELVFFCKLEDAEPARIEYRVNVPTAGNYKLIALTSFHWYTAMTIGGKINNNQTFVAGGESNLEEWYPFIVKGAHFFDCGRFNFNAGTNTITVHGELSQDTTYIYGFIVCQDYDENLGGGEIKFKPNIVPFKKFDGSQATLPSKLAVAVKMLRRDARPAILWDDEFRTYGEGNRISGVTYYPMAENNSMGSDGSGDYLYDTGRKDINGFPIYECRQTPQPHGYTQGIWRQENNRVVFDSNLQTNGATSGQLVLSKRWTVNLSIEATLNVERGERAGIRFYAQKQGTVGDGYIFLVDFERGVRELVYEQNIDGTLHQTTIASQAIGNINRNQSFIMKVLIHSGVAECYIGDVKAFVAGTNNPVTHNGSVNTSNGRITLQRTSGAVGIYASNSRVSCTHLGIGTLDRWETLEKFDVTIDGVTRNFGRINRTGYSYDKYGYLIYSGLDERVTRDSTQYPFSEDSSAVSLDYEVTVFEVDSWNGAKDLTIRLRDAGVWFAELLIGDREGMSIIWAGDAWSFLDVMNIAVNEYNAKGIGLWAMGQEDPKVWELIPDVVPKKT